MTPDQSRKFIEETQQFFLDFKTQVAKELEMFKSGVSEKKHFFSEWLTRVQDSNIQHVLTKTPWDFLSLEYAPECKIYSSTRNKNIPLKWSDKNEQWVKTLGDYLLRAKEAIVLKSKWLGYSGSFTLSYKFLLKDVNDILERDEIKNILEPARKTWYTNKTQQADLLIRLQNLVDSLKHLPKNIFEDTQKDIMIQAGASSEQKSVQLTKTSEKMQKQEADYLPKTFEPMFKLFSTPDKIHPQSVDRMVESLNIPKPRF